MGAMVIRMAVSPSELRERLRHVRWIGGAPGLASPPSPDGWQTVTTFSSTRSNPLEVPDRTTPDEAPFFHAFLSMDMDERWLRRSPQEMFETFHGFREEGFDLIVEEVLAMPADRPILVEGFKLLPRPVSPLLSDTHQAVWLLPTAEFRRKAFDSRIHVGDTQQDERSRASPRQPGSPRRALHAGALSRGRLLGSRMLEMDGGLDVEGSSQVVAHALVWDPAATRA